MVYGSQSLDSDTMPQMVPSAGFTPPCDYSAFAADSFDLSLLPGGECDLPLSPSTQLYTQSPPPSYEKPKIYTSFYPDSPEAFSTDIELGPDFQKLLGTTEDNKKDSLEVPTTNYYPDSPVGSSYCSTPEHVYQISPQYPGSPESFNLYPNSPQQLQQQDSIYAQLSKTDLFQSFGSVYANNSNISQFIKKEDNFSDEVYFQIKEENFLSPCSQASSPCSNYSNHSSPIPQYLKSDDTSYPNKDDSILNEVLLENNFLDKQIKQESTVDFGELLQNILNNNDDFKKPTEEVKPKCQDHQLLRQVLKDTSFQKKYNLKPFDFGLATGFVGAIKMEEPDEQTGELIGCNEELAREKIEPVLSLAIEQMRKDVNNTCSVLGISQDPSQWSSENVKAWLQWTVQQFSLEAEPDAFDMPGTELTALSEAEFSRRAPQNGSILHAQLEIWKAACMEDDFNMQWAQSNPTSNASNGEVSDDDDEESTPVQTTSSPKPAGTRTGGSHIHLWQFLKELLAAPQIHGSCIRWLDRGKGVFKIEDSVRVAKLWGKRKNRPAMNYDKLSRSIRQYYKKGIMKKTERSQRLVYQFCHPYCL